MNYLGDAAMLALFPQPEWHRSFLLYQLDGRTLDGLYPTLIAERNNYFLDDDQKKALADKQRATRA